MRKRQDSGGIVSGRKNHSRRRGRGAAGCAAKAELKSIEWKPLWAKPAIFAAAILALFVLLFKNKSAAVSDKKAAAYAD